MEETLEVRNNIHYQIEIEKKKEGVAKTLKDHKTKALFRKYTRNKMNTESKVQFHTAFQTIIEINDVNEPKETNNKDDIHQVEEVDHHIARK